MNTAFQKTAASDEWYTPRELVEALGMAVCWSPSGSPTQKSSGTAASRVSL